MTEGEMTTSLQGGFTLGKVKRLPGPLSAAFLSRQRRLESAAVTYPRRLPIAVRRAAGSYLEDMDGNVFIDFLTGAGVLTLGHNHPGVLQAARRQLDVFCHGLDFPSEPKETFTSAQLSMLPPSMHGKMKIHFCGPTGADAVEAALKIAKIYTGGDEIVSFSGGYHGCGHGGLSVSSVRSMKQGVAGRLPGVHFAPYSDCRGCALGLRRDTCETNCATYLERMLEDSHSGLGKPAAVIMELVQGEGGVVVADREFVQRVRKATERHRIPLVVDEIQTGCGRTGSWFAFEQFGIEPDIICASKALSGMGAPVSIVMYRRELDAWASGAHIGTFRGNQLAFAAGVAAIEVYKRERVHDNVVARSEQVRTFHGELLRKSSVVGQLRGLGLMLGLEIVDPDTERLSGDIAGRVQFAALERGLILEVGGRDDAIMRLLPPLNVSERTMGDALSVLEAAIAVSERLTPRRGRPNEGVERDAA